jgi:hypothetical protein
VTTFPPCQAPKVEQKTLNWHLKRLGIRSNHAKLIDIGQLKIICTNDLELRKEVKKSA